MRGNESPSLLEVEKLSVRYAARELAVDDVSLEVRVGEIVVIVGPNGAGKTSLVRAICGFAAFEGVRRTGSIAFGGRQIGGWDPARIARAGIAFIPERDKIFRNLSVSENLRIFAQRSKEGGSVDLPGRVYATFPWMHARRQTLAGYLSGGEQQLLALAAAILVQPRLLVIDEPMLGLAPVMVREIVRLLRDMHQSLGSTMLIVDQNLVATGPLADRCYAMRGGTLSIPFLPGRDLGGIAGGVLRKERD